MDDKVAWELVLVIIDDNVVIGVSVIFAGVVSALDTNHRFRSHQNSSVWWKLRIKAQKKVPTAARDHQKPSNYFTFLRANFGEDIESFLGSNIFWCWPWVNVTICSGAVGDWWPQLMWHKGENYFWFSESLLTQYCVHINQQCLPNTRTVNNLQFVHGWSSSRSSYLTEFLTEILIID